MKLVLSQRAQLRKKECGVQVNKPYLPLASGEFSVATGIALVTIFAAMVCESSQYSSNSIRIANYSFQIFPNSGAASRSFTLSADGYVINQLIL